METYRVISLFSGAMGLDLGLEKTGRFELVATVEKEKSFCDTIRANHKAGRLPAGLRVYEADISKLDPYEVMTECGLKPGELDVLVGGPPQGNRISDLSEDFGQEGVAECGATEFFGQ